MYQDGEDSQREGKACLFLRTGLRVLVETHLCVLWIAEDLAEKIGAALYCQGLLTFGAISVHRPSLCMSPLNRDIALSLLQKMRSQWRFPTLDVIQKDHSKFKASISVPSTCVRVAGLMWFFWGLQLFHTYWMLLGNCCFHCCSLLALLLFVLVPFDQMRLMSEG